MFVGIPRMPPPNMTNNLWKPKGINENWERRPKKSSSLHAISHKKCEFTTAQTVNRLFSYLQHLNISLSQKLRRASTANDEKPNKNGSFFCCNSAHLYSFVCGKKKCISADVPIFRLVKRMPPKFFHLKLHSCRFEIKPERCINNAISVYETIFNTFFRKRLLHSCCVA